MKKTILLALTISCFGLSNSFAQSAPVSLAKQPVKTVMDFLNWYRINQPQLDKIQLVNYPEHFDAAGNVTDTNEYYTVNDRATGQYLMALKKSGFVSQKYIAGQRAYFMQADSNFKQNHSYEGPPDGFDGDLIMLSQDYQLTGLNKSKAWLKMTTPKNAVVTISFPYNDLKLIYSMTNEMGKWKIDKIEDGRE